jgi:hypothetical protein
MDWRDKLESEESGIRKPHTRSPKRMPSWADKSSALRVLEMSVESGFFSYPYIEKDPLLNDLHGEPEFAQILNIAHQRHEAFKNSFFR